jgi:hypothetical protein
VKLWEALYIKVSKVFKHRINGFSDFIHHPDSKELENKKDENVAFWKLDLFPSSGEGRHLLC